MLLLDSVAGSVSCILSLAAGIVCRLFCDLCFALRLVRDDCVNVGLDGLRCGV